MGKLIASITLWLLLLIAPAGVRAQTFGVEKRDALQYGTHDGAALIGDLYLPQGAADRPAVIAVHGGGWQAGSRAIYQYMAPYLAARGYAVFSIDYRLTREGKNRFPAALHDVRASVQWVRSHAVELKIDPARIALMGDSAGAHLAALAGLAGDSPEYADGYRDDPYAGVSTKVKAVVGVYGVYDMTAQWEDDQLARPGDNIGENFIGFPPARDRRAWYAASPVAQAVFANNSTAFLLAFGTTDYIVDVPSQSQAFMMALKQACFFVRTVTEASAPHFRMADPVEAPGSFPGFLAPKLLRFFAEKL